MYYNKKMMKKKWITIKKTFLLKKKIQPINKMKMKSLRINYKLKNKKKIKIKFYKV